MKSLWFENHNGEERLIARVENWKEINQSINDFINQCNQNKINRMKEMHGKDYDESKVPLFKSYYNRVWQQKDGRYRIDVGSHTEFFITDVPME